MPLASSTADTSRPVLVTGATGQIGSPVLRELIAAGAHLVKLSGAHADPSAAPRFARWHGEVERIIRDAEIDYTFVQPVHFMQNLPAQIRSRPGQIQPEWLAQGVAELSLHMDTDVTDVVHCIVGREPIDIREFVQDHVADFGAIRTV